MGSITRVTDFNKIMELTHQYEINKNEVCKLKSFIPSSVNNIHIFNSPVGTALEIPLTDNTRLKILQIITNDLYTESERLARENNIIETQLTGELIKRKSKINHLKNN